jgi:hypothetical protein
MLEAFVSIVLSIACVDRFAVEPKLKQSLMALGVLQVYQTQMSLKHDFLHQGWAFPTSTIDKTKIESHV